MLTLIWYLVMLYFNYYLFQSLRVGILLLLPAGLQILITQGPYDQHHRLPFHYDHHLPAHQDHHLLQLITMVLLKLLLNAEYSLPNQQTYITWALEILLDFWPTSSCIRLWSTSCSKYIPPGIHLHVSNIDSHAAYQNLLNWSLILMII